MSRIGKLPIEISNNIDVVITGNNIRVKGPLGELSYLFSDKIGVSKENNELMVSPLSDGVDSLWGTTRSIINNMVIGVSVGYKKALEINGVGYKFEVSGNKLLLSIGYSHKVELEVPNGLKAELDTKQKNILYITGIDKQLVGEFAAKVRSKKKPEPYKGKGIKYVDEYVRRKAGKTGSK